MPKPYGSVAVASTFLQKYGDTGNINHLKLHKLVYYTYG